MNYTHIRVDVGAAEEYYKAIWINPDEFKNVIICLRDFLLFLVTVENFLVTVDLKRFYTRQECIQWVEQDQHFIMEVFTTCTGEFTK